LFLSRLTIGGIMDKKKWKSITLNINDYHAVRGVSYLQQRKFTGTITMLINDYIESVAKQKKVGVTKFKNQMIEKSKQEEGNSISG
tara:strand:+ start:1094 stop:1351 length:258 start_codon:yes stop_codon:yes gene_type:complete